MIRWTTLSAALILLFAFGSRASAAVYPGRGLTTSTGNQTGLHMVIRPDTAPVLDQARIDAIRASENGTREFYAEASGGKLDIRYVNIVDVPIQLVIDLRDNQLHRPNDWWSVAEDYVRNTLGLEPESFQLNLFDVSATPEDVNQGWAGVATFPGNNLAMQAVPGPGWGQIVVDHELGHRFGASHSSAWRLSDNSSFNPYVWDAKKQNYVQYSPGVHGLLPVTYGVELDDYGDPFSVMGNISHSTFSVHQKRTDMGWLSASQVPNIDASGDGTYRVYAHDQLQAVLSPQANVMGVVDGYSANAQYGLMFSRNDEVFQKGANAFASHTNTFTLEYRSEEDGVLIYLNDGVLDLDLTGGADRNHRERSLQVGDKVEDIVVSPSYFVGTGAINEWESIGAPAPTPYYELRPEWYEFRVLNAGSDAIGDFVDIAVDTVAYVPPGDLNDDGFFDERDVDVFVSNWNADTSQLNSIAQRMAGDLDNNGRVAMDDAFMLRQILLQHTSQLYEVLASVPEPSSLVLACFAIASLCGFRRSLE